MPLFYGLFAFKKAFLLLISIYSGMPRFRISQENSIWLKKKNAEDPKIEGKNLTETNPKKTTFASKNREFRKLEGRIFEIHSSDKPSLGMSELANLKSKILITFFNFANN